MAPQFYIGLTWIEIEKEGAMENMRSIERITMFHQHRNSLRCKEWSFEIAALIKTHLFIELPSLGYVCRTIKEEEEFYNLISIVCYCVKLPIWIHYCSKMEIGILKSNNNFGRVHFVITYSGLVQFSMLLTLFYEESNGTC